MPLLPGGQFQRPGGERVAVEHRARVRNSLVVQTGAALGAVQKVLAHCDLSDAPNTFNLGFGWVSIVPPAEADAALACGPGARILGEIDDSNSVSVRIS